MSFSSDIKKELEKKNFTLKNRHIKISETRDREAVKDHLRELFLRCGSVSDPNRNYHLELCLESREEALKVCDEISSFGLPARIAERNSRTIVYLKDSEAICDMLNILGAHQALMEFENVRILKEMRENVQRQVNCETSNLRKTVSASVRQSEDIEYIERHLGIKNLPEGLQEIAMLRLGRPDATLSELSEALSTPLSRSGVNHRLRKLSATAEELRNRNGCRKGT